MASGMPTTAGIASITSVSSAWSYVKGQCTYFVAQTLNWIPAGLGNAKDWLHNAQLKGYGTTSIPTVGSAVVYNPGGLYDPANGHVAQVTSVASDLKTFTVQEMNFKGPGIIDTRTSTMAGVAGFILAPGQAATGTPGGMAAGNANINLNPLDIPGAIGSAVTAIGKTVTQALYMIVGLVLFGFGMILLLKAEGIKTPSLPAVTPATAAVKAVAPKSAPAPAQSDEDRERAAERRVAATGRRPEPGMVKRGIAS